ncbi:MAG: class I SAM-dependent methyltransferase [Verrucomicrobia bacterium]|nr:class I SAM-dependent methyltransferase [Verrucomicrobiota bacterium]MBU6447016.1 class I SAM-dependent methyltransferase [Verrucomicrobiota bacterium]MDE3047124.1 class I SAM-dependent methyltransferase [Verrucomicrobiota bacterium]
MQSEQHVVHQKEYFEKNHKKTMQPRASVYISRQVDRVIAAGHLTKTDRIIDIGCGIGKYTINLFQRGYRVEGLDIASGLLDQLQTYAPIPVYCADISTPPTALYGQFDAAIGFFALHHMFDLEKSLQGAARLLKKGGRLLFLEPNPYNILYYLQILFTPKMTWQGEKGMVNMRSTILFPAMKKAGLIDCKLQRAGFFPPFITDLKGALAVEKYLEKIALWCKCLPFQIFMAKKG